MDDCLPSREWLRGWPTYTYTLLAPLYRPFCLPTRMCLAARTCPRPWLQVTWMKTAKATWLTCWRTVMHLLLTVQFCIHQCYCRVSPENKHYLLTYLLTYLPVLPRCLSCSGFLGQKWAQLMTTLGHVPSITVQFLRPEPNKLYINYSSWQPDLPRIFNSGSPTTT